MASLTNKRVLLGITGGIAAYKSADLVRRLQEVGAEVRVVMTQGAREFITPLTLQALSGHEVHGDLLDPKAEAAMGHIALARWADVVLVAPATAHFLAKLAAGEAPDLLSTLCLATKAMVVVAPAMNQGMWSNPATQANVTTLRARGLRFIGPASGGQACGDIGPGRMVEPAQIVEDLVASFQSGALDALRVLITAGPTREAIDPVRYISNHSSGKMGYALAAAAAEAGARVLLISGPVQLPCPDRVTRVDVVSAEAMLRAVEAHMAEVDIFIGAAAVADYRPEVIAAQKIKKQDADGMTLRLVKNPDIIAQVASQPRPPFCVGFAAETQDLENYARQKLRNKRLQMVIANDVAEPAIGFNSDDNAVTIVEADNSVRLDRRSKAQLARDLIQHIAQAYRKNKTKDSA